MKRAFTLIELMLVVAIMGLMGTISIGGYRAMRQGMEERGVLENAQGFMNIAYERAMIDGQPTAVYFWNETRMGEDDDESSLVVVGHAVAVRRTGRISYVDNGEQCLVDEFGDFRFARGTDDKGDDDSTIAKDLAKNSGTTMNLYRMKMGGSLTENRFPVAPTTMSCPQSVDMMLTDDDWPMSDVVAYGYRLVAGVGGKSIGSWTAGESYGTEFAEMTLPNNYIFESTFKTGTTDPIAEVNKSVWFYPPSSDSAGGGLKRIGISAIRPGADGSPSAISIGQTEDPASN